MTDDPAYPYWVCSYGDYPFGESGTSVYWRAPSIPMEVYIAVGEADLPLPIPPPPQTQGHRDNMDSWVDGRTIYAVGVDYIAYNDQDDGWVGVSDPLYVLKGTTVAFRAFQAPSGVNWPTNKPVWGGSSGASGTGETKTVTFNTKSNGLTDFKTVTVECGNVMTVKVIVYTLEGILWPDSQFAGRSQNDYGIEETVSLSYSTDPTGLPDLSLEWVKTGGVGLILFPGWKYDAQHVEGGVTLKLRHTFGPSKGLGPSYSGMVWKPSGTYMTRTHPTTVLHYQGYASAGIELRYWLNPSNVSFSNLLFKEGACSPTGVTGFFLHCEPWNSSPNGTIIPNHRETPTPPSIIVVDYHGSMVNGVDHSFTGQANPYAAGEYTYPIPTLYRDEVPSWHTFGQTSDGGGSFNAAGYAIKTKDGASPGSAALNDPDSNY